MDVPRRIARERVPWGGKRFARHPYVDAHVAAAGRDFCGLATRFAVVWAFGALWFDFLVSNTRQHPLTAKREMSGLYAFAQSGISHDHRAAPHGPKVPYTTHCDLAKLR